MRLRTYCTIVMILVANCSFATDYYVNSNTGSDANNGTTTATPWASLTPVNNGNFQPGDTINFARGSSWSIQAFEFILRISRSGTAQNRITFRAYGTGDKPSFTNGGNRFNSGISIAASYVTIEDLLVQNTGNYGFRLQTGANYNIIRNCEVTTTGIAFYINDNSSYNLLTNNYIHDLKMVVNDTGEFCSLPSTDPRWTRNPCDNDFGATSFWLRGPYNEISYNRSINNVGPSFDYGVDGGFLEFYANCTGTYVHHNYVDQGVGIVEASVGQGTNTDITIAYNIFIENRSLFVVKPSFPTSNFKVENNTFITAAGTPFDNMFGEVNGLFFRNNIFVLGGAGERVGTSNVFTHTNNIFHLLNGAVMGSVILGDGEFITDPLFVDLANKDLRLQPNSPAINAGANLSYTIDYLGNAVPFGPAPDMGAFESNALVPEINTKQAGTNIPDNSGNYNYGLVDYATPNKITFTIENLGGAVLNLNGNPRVNVTGAGFTLATDAPPSIAAGATATFEVTLTTTQFIAYNGSISIASNDVNENPYNFSVTGEGYDATKGLQTISFNPLPIKSFGDVDFDPGATASSGLAVNYISSNTAVATIVNGNIKIVGEGISIITANQAGNASFNPAKAVTKSLPVLGADFVQGNIVVSRVGNGTTALGANTASVSLLEFNVTVANQAAPLKTVPVGSLSTGSRLTANGNVAYEGQLSRTTDGRYLSIIGYDQPTGETAATSTAGNKVIGRVNYKGLVDYSTNFPTSASGNAKIAVSDNGSRFWTGINNIGFVNFGQTTTPIVVNNVAQRSLGIFNDRFYHQQGFSSLNFTNVALPTGSSALTNTATVPSSQSYQAFAFLDMDANVSWNSTGLDVLYVANVNAGLEKYYFNGTAWIAINSNANTPSNSYFPGTSVSALIATVNNNGNPVIYATSGNGTATNNRLYAITDVSGRTNAMVPSGASPTVTILTLATAGANYGFRGVAFSPSEFPLPIGLVSFAGSLVNNTGLLKWLTASEVNAQEFVIEKGQNGRDFLAIGRVPAKNTFSPNSYQFEDFKLLDGLNYYRLRMVDKDGSFKYSKVVVIRVDKNFIVGLSIFPNPVLSTVTVSHPKARAGAFIQIMSVDGRVIRQYAVAKNAVQTSIDASELMGGNYLVNYINDGKAESKMILKW